MSSPLIMCYMQWAMFFACPRGVHVIISAARFARNHFCHPRRHEFGGLIFKAHFFHVGTF